MRGCIPREALIIAFL